MPPPTPVVFRVTTDGTDMITAAGAGSGIDVESIISSLMLIEQRQITVLEQKQTDNTTELSDVGRLRSGLDALEAVADKLSDPDQFGAYTALSSDEEVLVATSSQGRFPENHSIEVLALATNHRVISSAFSSADDAIGAGQYDFSAGEESFSVVLDASENSLLDLRDAINDSADNSTVQASIINTDAGSQLVLTSIDSGTENTITAPAQFTELTAAQDAQFTINGLTATSSSNNVTEVIAGLTLDLKSTGTVNIESTRSVDAIKETFEEFASAYNSLQDTISSVSEGSMQGDGLLRQVENNLRDVFFTTMDVGDGNELSLLDYGFTFDKFGDLSVDADKLDDAVSGGVSVMIDAFTTPDTGFADLVIAEMDLFTSAGGYFDLRIDAIEARDKSIDSQIERMEYRMEQVETRYRSQFGAMDIMISELQTNGNYLLQSLSNLG